MAFPTAREQMMLELVNRARLDPKAEAARFGINLNDGLAPGSLDGTTKQPLAMNALLVDAARFHSDWMLDTDTFSHTGAAGSSPGDRMTDAGYVFSGSWTWGENISWRGTTGTPDLTAFIIEQHRSLFLSAGHRENILADKFREIGVGQEEGRFDDYNASVVTQNFAATGKGRFLTGVVYDDASGDDFYSVGEGKGGEIIAVGNKSALTSSAGGYQLKVRKGKTDIVFGDGAGAAEVRAIVRSDNAKVDLVNGDELRSSVSLKALSNIKSATLLGLEDLRLTGGAGGEILRGNKGDNVLRGSGGDDRLAGGPGDDRLEGGANDDKLVGGAGADRIAGGAGTDRMKGAADADTFVFRKVTESTPGSAGRDIIIDFRSAQGDVVKLKPIDARTDIAGNQDFTFIDKAKFSGQSGELRYKNSGNAVIVIGDVDGDARADFSIRLAKTSDLAAGDFIL